jgi:hypothetical protein
VTKNIDEAENISAHARTTCSAASSVIVTSLDASSGDGSVSQLQCFGDGSAWKTNTQRPPVTNESTAVDVDVEPAAGAASASLIFGDGFVEISCNFVEQINRKPQISRQALHPVRWAFWRCV